jgi:transcriptional regulator with XRE-family HTH domain
MGLSIDQSAISKMEQGHRPVLDFEVVALAKALNVSAAWLLGEDDSPKEPSNR